MKYIQIATALLAVLFLTTLIACSRNIEEVTPIANFVSAHQQPRRSLKLDRSHSFSFSKKRSIRQKELENNETEGES